MLTGGCGLRNWLAGWTRRCCGKKLRGWACLGHTVRGWQGTEGSEWAKGRLALPQAGGPAGPISLLLPKAPAPPRMQLRLQDGSSQGGASQQAVSISPHTPDQHGNVETKAGAAQALPTQALPTQALDSPGPSAAAHFLMAAALPGHHPVLPRSQGTWTKAATLGAFQQAGGFLAPTVTRFFHPRLGMGSPLA